MTIELPAELEPVLKARANAHGISVSGYVREVVERELAPLATQPAGPAFETGHGALAGTGRAPSAEEIEQNRLEMFRSFGDSF